MKPLHNSAVIVVTLAMGLIACQRASKDEATAPAGTHSPAAVPETKPSAKWSMPEPMMVHMRNLEKDVKALGASEEKDHTALAAKIDGHTKQVIATCTMDGKAHDALHEWLMPFLQLNKEYAAATDAATMSAKFKAIQDSLAVFHERFE